MVRKEVDLRDILKELRSLKDTMHCILKWIKYSNFQVLRKTIENFSDKEKMAYELTDGERSRRDIAKELGISDSTIQAWWDKWFRLGIVEPSETRKGRPRRMFSLDELGIQVTVPKKKRKRQVKKK